jgi:NADP-dependent 3-hydroxy acid dehydrogenase YdfG
VGSKKELIRRRYYSQRVVWLTGASTGIGEALARELITTGAQLVISARDGKKLEKLSTELGENCIAIPADISLKEQNIAAVEAIIKHFGRLDTIILNAGINSYVDRDDFNSGIFEKIIQTNFMGMVYGIEAALPYLKQANLPHIVGMSSTAAYRGLPRAEAYGASKAAIKNMLEALRLNLLPLKISVSVICPGFVKTPLTDQNDFNMPFRIPAEEAANTITDQIARYKQEIHFPKRFSIPIKLLSFLPSEWYTALLKGTVRDTETKP